MSRRESIARYNLIIKTLRKHPATFREIYDYLALESELQGYNYKVSIRTFQRYVEDISSLYNIEIKYDYSRKVYFIDNEEMQDANHRILEAFDTFNALNITDRLSNYVYFEKTRLKGTHNFYDLLHGIKNCFAISFTYSKYWDDEISTRMVEPYALKEFKQRWYLVSKDLKDNRIKSFALDRMDDVVITKTKFIHPEDFNIKEYFSNCFGIIRPDDSEIMEVILSFDTFQGKYIKSLPLHHSQVILKDTKEELVIKLTLYITHDFLMEILSYGDAVKIIHPESLVDEIKTLYQASLNQYGI